MSRYLVTGATSGVGRELVRLIYDNDPNAQVVVVGRDRMRLASVVSFRAGCEACVLDFDTCELIDVTTLVKMQGPFDGIFHGAGSEMILPLRLTDDAHYRKAMRFADSSFAILRAAVTRGALNDGGSVVVMSSVAATRATAGMAGYSAARAAVEAMVRVAAREAAPRRIRVNALAAGAFKSALHDRLVGRMSDAGRQAYEAAHPLGFGTAADVAETAFYLLAKAPWVTGTTTTIDGGLSA